MTEAEGFRESLHPTLMVNCVANAFLSFTAIVRVECHNDTSAPKNAVVVEDFENIATKLGYF